MRASPFFAGDSQEKRAILDTTARLHRGGYIEP
jgi:hypothetical protein